MKPHLLKTVRLLLGESSEAKMRQISFSYDTIQRRISGMSEDVRQVINETIASAVFSFHVDEYTDVQGRTQGGGVGVNPPSLELDILRKLCYLRKEINCFRKLFAC